MKALAIDTAVSCITIAAKNNDKNVTVSLDVGMHQSEKLLPTIEYVMKECSIEPKELDFIALSKGPGSFTGLRLGFAAAKSLNLVTKCPIYGVHTLEAYALPYKNWIGNVISAIDAKKDRFFVAMYKDGNIVQEESDLEPEKIIEWVKTETTPVLIVGPDSLKLFDAIKQIDNTLNILKFDGKSFCSTDFLFNIAEKMIEEQKNPMTEYEGPIYLRKSEAEEKAGC